MGGRKRQNPNEHLKPAPSLAEPDLMTHGEHTLPPKFWARFVKHYWEKRPLVIKQPFSTPFINAAETFGACSHFSCSSQRRPLVFSKADARDATLASVSAYREAMADLFRGKTDVHQVIVLKDFYENLEATVDRCQHVGDLVEGIVIKNT
jgi:hypothetical protein